MPFVEGWASGKGRLLLAFDSSAIATFERHVQREASDQEAGGLLLGRIHGTNIFVTEATLPTRWDRRWRYLFERMPFGHRAIAQARWTASGGTIRYLGEWHTHPEDHPEPSTLDRIEWTKLARKRADGRPLLAVVVGRMSLHVELVQADGSTSALLPA